MTDIDPKALALRVAEKLSEQAKLWEGSSVLMDIPSDEARALAAFLREAVSAHEALAPFSAVAEHDIGESESDTDLFRPMSAKHARAPLLTVGDLRRARTIIAGPTPPARIEDSEEPSHERR
ncbi:hypothetical protein [Xanthobacter flavus]|uniref:hypothetical protein n=1 Tax=Xanthobacter flavus TaxID=281 RepID=UPI00372C0258